MEFLLRRACGYLEVLGIALVFQAVTSGSANFRCEGRFADATSSTRGIMFERGSKITYGLEIERGFLKRVLRSRARRVGNTGSNEEGVTEMQLET